MMITTASRTTLGLLISMTLAACGGGKGGAGGTTGGGGSSAAGTGGGNITGGGGSSGGGSFEPTSAGATWSYSTTDLVDGGTVPGTKVATVDASEPVPGRAGITAWRIHTVVSGAEDQLTWQSETATGIVRYRDDIYTGGGTTDLLTYSVYAPSKLRIDTTAARLVTGATYTESYTETVTDVKPNPGSSSSSKPFGWKVVSDSEAITVPAGSFSAVHLQKSNGNSGAIDKDYWFVRGVGKVKETSSAGRTELLTSYNIP